MDEKEPANLTPDTKYRVSMDELNGTISDTFEEDHWRFSKERGIHLDGNFDGLANSAIEGVETNKLKFEDVVTLEIKAREAMIDGYNLERLSGKRAETQNSLVEQSNMLTKYADYATSGMEQLEHELRERGEKSAANLIHFSVNKINTTRWHRKPSSE